MACTATFLLSKYQFFTLARITQHLIIYTPTEKLITSKHSINSLFKLGLELVKYLSKPFETCFNYAIYELFKVVDGEVHSK